MIQVSSRGYLYAQKKKNLDHMNQDNGDHEIRAPTVKGANVPTERNIVIESLEAIPSLSGRGHINKRQHDAGNDLKHKHDEGSAAEHVKPAGGFARYPMLHRLTDRCTNLKARVQPVWPIDQSRKRMVVSR